MKTRLGATLGPDGVTFALYSRHATAVELCLFENPEEDSPERTVSLERDGEGLWSTRIPGLGHGQLYGYRVDGPHRPQEGHRFNSTKLLVDPRARAITDEPSTDPALFASLFGFEPKAWPDPQWHRSARSDLSYNGRDSAAASPKSVVVDPSFDWQGDRPPRTAWSDTVIYECHVRGMTQRHPEVDPRLRGTYLGLAQEPVVEHLLALGVTAVELLPVQQIAREPHLVLNNLPNYWGYSTLGFFAPHAGYATGNRGEQVTELKTMVRELHRAGLEVILDVVYNHTAEGDHLGPTLSLRGIDNRTYYRLRRHNPRYYADYSGCGNTLEMAHPEARGLVLDSLRYWVEEMHVDGFRFDLAPALARHGRSGDRPPGRDEAFDPEARFLTELAEDPVLSRVKLIAEPWDLGPEGYRLGGFPAGWAEWNDRYRDAARGFWRGDGGATELAERLAGSRDVFGARGPQAGIDFVTCHDGFTLADLVSYEGKHNEANGEDNRDGPDHNLSRNWGREGPTDDPTIGAARDRARRNLMTTLLLSRGVPMLLAGDELGRTQGGNNNTYCQDNDLSWVDWSLEPGDEEFLAFVRHLASLRRRFPALRGEASRDPTWLLPDGTGFSPRDPQYAGHRAFARLVHGADAEGDLLALLNGGETEVAFLLPGGDGDWTELLDTAQARPPSAALSPTLPVQVAPFSLRLLRLEPTAPPRR